MRAVARWAGGNIAVLRMANVTLTMAPAKFSASLMPVRGRANVAMSAPARTLPASSLDVQVVSLSLSFGKEAALMAGLDHSRCDAVLFMDGDGQHRRR